MTPDRAIPIRVEVKKDAVYVNGNPTTLKDEARIRQQVDEEQKLSKRYANNNETEEPTGR
jgi:hypothetical protein